MLTTRDVRIDGHADGVWCGVRALEVMLCCGRSIDSKKLMIITSRWEFQICKAADLEGGSLLIRQQQ